MGITRKEEKGEDPSRRASALRSANFPELTEFLITLLERKKSSGSWPHTVFSAASEILEAIFSLSTDSADRDGGGGGDCNRTINPDEDVIVFLPTDSSRITS